MGDEVVKAVAARLEDKDSDVRRAAVGVLGEQSALPDEVVKAVATRLEDEVSGVRWAAVDMLVTARPTTPAPARSSCTRTTSRRRSRRAGGPSTT